MIFNTFNKKCVLKQVYIAVIRNPVSLAFYDRTQTDFGTRVNVGNTTLSMETTGDKPKVDDPGKNADSPKEIANTRISNPIVFVLFDLIP